MRRFWSAGPRRLRWKLLRPLGGTFALLWLGTMALLTHNTCRELESSAKAAARSAQTSLEEHCEFYENNLANGLGDEAANILRNNLSSLSLGQVSEMDGGMALTARTEAGYVRSQLAWGWGHREGVDIGQRWYISLDEGLDDRGQLELARWIVAHRSGWEYGIYPPDDREGAWSGDGSFARITGLERPGHAIAVQKIEIIHPDGTADTMVETALEGAGETWDFAYLQVRSVLLPSWSSNGKDGPVNMERRLASFREAQAILDREIAGAERSVWKDGGFALGSTMGGNTVLQYLAVQCDVLPAALKQEAGLYLSTGLLTLIVLLVLSARLSRQVTEPVEQLCARVAEGASCPENGPIRELNALAAAFHSDQARREAQLTRERDFARAAAHELKTPLAVLRFHAEALREDIAPEKRAQYLDIILDESDRMGALVGEMLDLSRLEAGAVRSEVLPVELAELAEETLSRLAPGARAKGVRLEPDLHPALVSGDRARLERVLSNLTSNALRHCPAGGAVRVHTERIRGQAVLTVENDGEPVPEQDLPRLWEPFFKGDRSRSRARGGAGLGLAIVRAAVLAHGGSCTAENVPGGVRFQVRLPALQSER